MEITRNQPQSIPNKSKTSKSSTSTAASALASPLMPAGTKGLDLGATSSYDVALSPKAANLQKQKSKAFDIAKKTSPIREDKIQSLKEKIASGEYVADSNQIADGIVREAVRDQLAREPYPA